MFNSLRCSNLAATDHKEREGMLDEVDLWSDPAQSFLLSSEVISDLFNLKCFLNTFKIGLDTCMSSALNMSLSFTVYVCIYLFFWIELLLKCVYLLTGPKSAAQSRLWSLGQRGAKTLFLQLEEEYLCLPWICLFALRDALGPHFSLQGFPKGCLPEWTWWQGELGLDRAHALDALET